MRWIDKIAQGITKTFEAIRPSLPAIPAILLVCEASRRPGLSAIALTSAVIRRLPEVGIETGVNSDGSPNKINGFVRVLCEEIVNEIKTNGVGLVSFAPMQLQITSNGVVDPSGHVTTVGTNITAQQAKSALF